MLGNRIDDKGDDAVAVLSLIGGKGSMTQTETKTKGRDNNADTTNNRDRRIRQEAA